MKFCGLLTWRYGLPCFGMAPPARDMDSQASMGPFEWGMWNPMTRCGAFLLGHGLPCIGMARRVRDMDLYEFVAPLKLGIWTRTLSNTFELGT